MNLVDSMPRRLQAVIKAVNIVILTGVFLKIFWLIEIHYIPINQSYLTLLRLICSDTV